MRRVRSVVYAAVLLLLPACAAPTPAPTEGRPKRIVSLDYCADQYVLALLDRDRIAAVSPDADAPFSYMRAAAAGLAQVAPRAEDVLVLKPDLVVLSYGGGPGAAQLFARAGVPVLQLGYAPDLAGVRRVLMETADGLGEPSRGAAMAADFDRRLGALATHDAARAALYVTPGGVTTGPGSLVHEMLTAAGLANFQTRPGWASLPLEDLAYDRPDLIAAAFFGENAHRHDNWSAIRHPLAQDLLRDRPTVSLEGAWTACGGWFVLDAVEALAAAR